MNLIDLSNKIGILTGAEVDYMLKLDNKNGLYNFVNNLIESGMEMYLDKRNGKVTLYYERLKQDISLERLKIMIADYISRHMLMESYKNVVIYQW